MSECKVTIITENETETVSCKKETTILEAVGEKYRSFIETPCGGKGTCGKCLVRVEGDGASGVTEIEKKKLSETELARGFRLACSTRITGDITVTLNDKSGHIVILEDSTDFQEHLNPCIKKKYVSLSKPTLEDQRDDLKRLRDELNLPDHRITLKEIGKLPLLLRDNGFSATAVYNDAQILTVEQGNTEDINYGLAVDIGTTTVVVYLLDMSSGKKIGVASGLNVQKSYGQDVIARINHTMTDDQGLETLHNGIIGQLNELIDSLVATHKIDRKSIYSMTIAGNSTMMHLAAGIPPKNIAAAPFIPASLEMMRITAAEMGITIAEQGWIYLLPGISAYIGADITAATLASGMAKEESLSLLIDIGTNGEIMLGNKDRLLSCSTAAGPAFEGATIRDGVGGIAGAIDTVALHDSSISCTTIAGKKPLGICGSGIVDAISNLLYAGIIDETGRMVDADDIENETGKHLAENRTELDGQAAYILVQAEDTSHGDAILLTQKDVREVQNAKASIAAGITTLIKTAGKSVQDIDRVFLAGGFGSYIDKHHAIHIGLIPKELENKIEVIGNAAGSGAIMALLSREKFQECSTLSERTEYIELSSSPEFMDDYVNSMMFS